MNDIITGAKWNYAGLSKLAKQYGGPEALVHAIKSIAGIRGGLIGASVAVAGSALIFYNWPRIKKYFKNVFSGKGGKMLEEELIAGIKRYEQLHSDNVNPDYVNDSGYTISGDQSEKMSEEEQ